MWVARWPNLEAELIGRHFFDGRDRVFLTTGERVSQDVGYRVLGLLSESGGGKDEQG